MLSSSKITYCLRPLTDKVTKSILPSKPPRHYSVKVLIINTLNLPGICVQKKRWCELTTNYFWSLLSKYHVFRLTRGVGYKNRFFCWYWNCHCYVALKARETWLVIDWLCICRYEVKHTWICVNMLPHYCFGFFFSIPK